MTYYNNVREVCDLVCGTTIDNCYKDLVEGRYLGGVWTYYHKDFPWRGITQITSAGNYTVKVNVDWREYSITIRVVVRHDGGMDEMCEIAKEKGIQYDSEGGATVRAFVNFVSKYGE